MYTAMVFSTGSQPKTENNLTSYNSALSWCRNNSNYDDDTFVVLDSKTQVVERCGMIEYMYEDIDYIDEEIV